MARRILVVEDEAPIREMVCFVLEQNGFQPVEAEDYDSAVNQLNEPWPDLILLDWMLPGGSGIQFIKHLKRESMTRDIPVVMLTASRLNLKTNHGSPLSDWMRWCYSRKRKWLFSSFSPCF